MACCSAAELGARRRLLVTPCCVRKSRPSPKVCTNCVVCGLSAKPVCGAAVLTRSPVLCGAAVTAKLSGTVRSPPQHAATCCSSSWLGLGLG